MPRRAWTENEVLFLRENIGKLSYEELGKKLGRTKTSVRQAAVRNNLSFRKQKAWTKREIFDLAALSELYTAEAAAEKMGRSVSSIMNAAQRNGIKFQGRRIKNTDVAAILGINKHTVARLREKLGLRFRQSSMTSSNSTRGRGASGSDIVTMARYLLENPSTRLKTSAKHLREVIEEYEGYE